MTAVAALIFLLMFLSITAEVFAGSFGLVLPFSAMAVFYISGLYGWRSGILAGVVAGALLDLLYGRTLPLTAFPLASVGGFALLWTVRGSMKSYLMQVLPGVATGLLISAEIMLYSSGEGGFCGKTFHLSQALSIILETALIMPLFVWAMDRAAGFFGFEKLCGVKTEITTRTEVK